jgi:hypothetical protein
MAVSAADSLPDDIELLKQLVRMREAELARVRAEASGAEALISHLRLTIAKMRRELFGQHSERKANLLDQMELQLEELEASAAEDELAAEQAATAVGETTPVHGFARNRPARKPFPAHLPRGCAARSRCLRLLWLAAARQARRGCHRDTGSGAAAVEGGAIRPREVHLPRL